MVINILAGLASLVAIFLVVALFIKKDYYLAREIIINKPVSEVFEFVKYLRNQEVYSKWVMTDPNMQTNLKGVDGTVGFIYGWNGNNKAGEGEQEIVALEENKKVDIEIRFIRPFKSRANTPIVTEPVSDNQTKVIWSMSGRQNYPLNLMSAMMAGVLKRDLDISLSNLKSVLEHNER